MLVKWGYQHNWYPPAKWFRKSLIWVKLSNSGNTLKLLVPNLVGNYGGGWINYSYKVTNQEMIEREMGNRGSKSITKHNVIVKEQRVYGSWYGMNLPYLRCTLTGFERSYLVKILSNQVINKRSYSTNIPKPKPPKSSLNSWTLVGFVDAEGTFMVRVRKNSKYKTGWLVVALFSITLDKKDLFILEEIKSYFGGLGSIKKSGEGTLSYRIESSIQLLNVIIPHFDKYWLITQKVGDYLLFKDVVKMLIAKEHLTVKGLNKIVSIKASINKGISEELKADFPQSFPVTRPIGLIKYIPNPYWVAGFTSGDGSFKVIFRKSSTNKVGFQVLLLFQVTQHARDEILIKSLISYLGCGYLEKDPRGPWLNFKVSKFSDICEKIIPFFQQYEIIGVKSKDFKDWCEIAELVKTGLHLTKYGLDQIIYIRSRMNKGRPYADNLDSEI